MIQPITPDIAAAKQKFDRLIMLDLQRHDIVTAHGLLGEAVGSQAQRTLRYKLDQMNPDQIGQTFEAVGRARNAIVTKSRAASVDPKLRYVLAEYLACLDAWAQGAGLHNLRHSTLQSPAIAGHGVSAGDLALLLQHDNVGCQTGVLRTRAGGVIFWHTEEDVEEQLGSRFDALRIVTFRVGKDDQAHTVNAFVYPDLLPGPAFAWRSDGFVQAVDALILRPDRRDGDMLANVLAWVTLRLGRELPLQSVIAALGPYIDGYAMVTVQPEGARVHAAKVEFAGSQAATSVLGDDAGSFFFQVNVFSDPLSPVAQSYETLGPHGRSRYEQRITRTERSVTSEMPTKTAEAFLQLLSSREGDDYAYCNEHVKAYLVGEIASHATNLWIGAGPALEHDKLYAVRLTHR